MTVQDSCSRGSGDVAASDSELKLKSARRSLSSSTLEIGEESLAEVVAAFYDGAASPELWPAAGERLGRLLGAPVAVARLGSAHAGLGESIFYAGPGPTPQPEYAAHFHRIDPHLKAALAPSTPQSRRGMLGHEFMDLRAYRRGEFYNEFGRRFGIAHTLGASTRLGDGTPARLGLFRSAAMASFNEADRRVLAALMPHFWRSLELLQRLDLRRPDAEMVGLRALDALPQAVVVADAACRVTFANAAAGRLAAAERGLRLVRLGPAVGGGELVLSAAHRDDAAALARLVGAVAALGKAGHALPLRRDDGKDKNAEPPLAVLVCPLPARLADANAGPRAALGLALVLATDPCRPVVPSATLLCDVFGLSAVEAAVTRALAGGRSVEEVARRRGVGTETVRTQVRAVLSKTGAANLRDLERLLASLHGADPVSAR